jgi:hypothetical protein
MSRMRDTHPIQVHDYEKRLNWAVRHLKAQPNVSQRNKDHIMKFLDRLNAEGLSLARQTGYVQRLTTIAVMLQKDFHFAAKEDIERLTRTINAREWAEWTKDNYRVSVKRLRRWLKNLEKEGSA